MNFGIVGNYSSGITNGNSALQSAKINKQNQEFNDLVKKMEKKSELSSTISSEMISEEGRLNGDYTTGFSGIYKSESDKNASVKGAAANQGHDHVQGKTIDKTSKLYEQCMELECFFVKQMLSSMRNTVLKTNENDFAQDMYEDMLYDEYAESMTKNAGFGLADQIYLSLI